MFPCCQDQKVSWHATPFEERLMKVLSDEKPLHERSVCYNPAYIYLSVQSAVRGVAVLSFRYLDVTRAVRSAGSHIPIGLLISVC